MSPQYQAIRAEDKTIDDLLNGKKYTVDYFQREYSWEKKHIDQLVADLTTGFLDEYDHGHPRTQVEQYNSYYLGPIVIKSKDGALSIIDGQQRLTSLSLFLIYLNHVQKDRNHSETIEPLVYSEKYGRKSFNMQVEEREQCLRSLFENGTYVVRMEDDESVSNMVERYSDIANAFPDELKDKAFPYFLDWLKYKVVLVEIIAFSDDNAYAIFETMNDRGLNLTASEMLKSYLLSRFRDSKKREATNTSWKKMIQQIRTHDKEEDLQFFQAWLRSQYADTIRMGRAGSTNEDFEIIGTRFHAWVRDNLNKMNLDPEDSDAFDRLINTEIAFFKTVYIQILNAQKSELQSWEPVYFIRHWGIAQSLQMPLLMAPLRSADNPETIRTKIILVARFIETFTVKRSINFKKFSASSIRYTMYNLVKEIRGSDVETLRSILSSKLHAMDESWHGALTFRMHGQNRWFVKHLLSRITSHVERLSGIQSRYQDYYWPEKGKPFEIEHIWADRYTDFKDMFPLEADFSDYRNRIGGLLLLPNGTNQSYGALPYSVKKDHYVKENLFAKSLHPKAYENNPNFTGMIAAEGLPFKAHADFKKQDLDQRQELIKSICEKIWPNDLL